MKAKTKTNPRSKKGDGIIKNLLYDIATIHICVCWHYRQSSGSAYFLTHH